MRLLVGKRAQLVFDRRAVTRPDAVDLAGKEGRAVKARTQDLMHARVRVDDVAALLRTTFLDGGRLGKEREACGISIAFLPFELREVERPGVDPGWRSGLHPADSQPGIDECLRQTLRRKLAHSAAFTHLCTDKNASLEEGSGRQNHGFGRKFSAHPETDTRNMRFSARYGDDRILPNV